MGRSHQPVHHAWCRSMPSATAGWSRTPNSGTCPSLPGTVSSDRSGQAPGLPAGRHRDGSSGTRRAVRRGWPPDWQGSAVGSRLPPHQAAPPWSSRILQGGPQAIHLLPVFLDFRMPLLMKSIDPSGHVARMLPFGLQFSSEPFGG